MKSRLIASSFTALMIAAAPVAVVGIAWMSVPAQADTAAMPLNKVIGAKAVDQNNDTVGDVVGVIVAGTNGNIQSLIVDVGSWISGKKDVQVPYSGVTQNKDGNLVVPLTKDQAKSMAAYSYSDPGLRGKVLSDTGSVYQPSSTAATATTANTTTDTATANIMASDTTSGSHDSVMNADGSLNSSEVVGLKVENGNKDNIGKIGELLINKNGRVEGVVVDVGGFLGMGAHPVRLDWKKLQFKQQDGSTIALIDASKDSLKAMPEYKTSSM
jgi:sporulation protein YlmC with PRC-barrel domain